MPGRRGRRIELREFRGRSGGRIVPVLMMSASGEGERGQGQRKRTAGRSSEGIALGREDQVWGPFGAEPGGAAARSMRSARLRSVSATERMAEMDSRRT